MFAVNVYSKMEPLKCFGEMAEWFKAHDWKSCVLTIITPRVQIPLSPPTIITLKNLT